MQKLIINTLATKDNNNKDTKIAKREDSAGNASKFKSNPKQVNSINKQL